MLSSPMVRFLVTLQRFTAPCRIRVGGRWLTRRGRAAQNGQFWALATCRREARGSWTRSIRGRCGSAPWQRPRFRLADVHHSARSSWAGPGCAASTAGKKASTLVAASTPKASTANRWCPAARCAGRHSCRHREGIANPSAHSGSSWPTPKPTGVEAGRERHAANDAELSLVPSTFRVGDGHLDQPARLRANTAHGRGAQLYP
jgi:hypothetical protein